MSDRPTPRTDAAANESIVKVYETSKQLERELAEAMRERDNAESDRIQAEADTIRALHERNKARDELALYAEAINDIADAFDMPTGSSLVDTVNKAREAREQRDRLAEAMRKMWPFIEEDYHPNCSTLPFAEAVAEYQSALAAMKGGADE